MSTDLDGKTSFTFAVNQRLSVNESLPPLQCQLKLFPFRSKPSHMKYTTKSTIMTTLIYTNLSRSVRRDTKDTTRQQHQTRGSASRNGI